MKPLFERPQTPMNLEQTQMLMGLHLLPDEAIQSGINDISDEFLYKVMRKRLDVLAIPVDNRVILFILGALDIKTPGAVAMHVHALFEMKKRGDAPIITLDEFTKYFHSGFPSEKVLSEAWADQKTPNGHNMIDAQELYV